MTFTAGAVGPRQVVISQSDLAGNSTVVTRNPIKAEVPRVLISSPSNLSRSKVDASLDLTGECDATLGNFTLEGEYVDVLTAQVGPLTIACPANGLWSRTIKLLEPDNRFISIKVKQTNTIANLTGEDSRSYERSEAQLLDKSQTGIINTAVTMQINLLASNPSVWRMTFSSIANTNILSHTSALGGLWEITDAQAFKVKYTPALNFRGLDQVRVYAYDDRGRVVSALLRVDIDNDIQNIRPVLAVRGMACLTCHATVASSVISDFGIGDTWFGANNWTVAGYFANAHAGWQTLNVLGDTSRVIVPQASVLDYLNGLTIANNTATDWKRKLVGATTIRIGAPTVAEITDAGRLLTTTEAYRFFKDNNSGPALSGLSYNATAGYLYNSGELICYGDLFVKDSLYLKNVSIKTNDHGCRIYALKSIFIEGAINYVNTGDNPKRNLQMTSAVSINLGIGHGVGTCNGSTYGRYVSHASWPAFNRNGFLDIDVYNESLKIADLRDAGCDTTTNTDNPALRNVPFERILMNAPVVHSRYNGNVKGFLIAEVAVFALGAFTFTYDDAFGGNVILPLMRFQNLVAVDGFTL